MSEFTVPTHEVTTPKGGQKVVLKDFISGYDDEAIESIYTRGSHTVKAVDPNDPDAAKKNQDMEIDGSAIQDAEREGVKRVVLSVDGESDNIIDLVYNMRKEDTKFVKKCVNEVVNPKEDEPAKKNNGSKPTPVS